MGTLEWVEPWRDNESGVDHLGMRVAGENHYSKLLDFTTTVSWRPRYFSFLCWALRRSFFEAGGREGAEEHRIDSRIWRTNLRRRDYAMVAATLLVDPGALRIAGSDKVRAALDGARADGTIKLAADHLRAANASLAIYLGPMLQLGLVQSASGIHRPSAIGMRLADAFERSVQRSGSDALAGGEMVSVAALHRLGDVCGLTRLSSDDAPAEVRDEREAIRDAIFDWGRLDLGEPRATNRLMSIGLVLAAHELATESVDLEAFRTFTLHDGRRGPFAGQVSLPPSFARVRDAWRVYQAHAYATFALESFLSVVLSRGFELQVMCGDGVPAAMLLDDLGRSFADGTTRRDPLGLGDAWGSGQVGDIVAALAPRLDSEADILEAELHHRLAHAIGRGDVRDVAVVLVDATALFLLSLIRLRWLQRRTPTAWLGDRTAWRLPPARLVEFLERAETSAMAEMVPHILLRDLVVDQHRRNALRKLEADPGKYTAKLSVEAGRLVILDLHRPGTSNPRFENAVTFLRDLGFLDGDKPTADGLVALERLRSGSAS